MVCGQWGLSGIRGGVRTFGGLELQGQPDGSPVRKILEGSFTEEGTVSKKCYIWRRVQVCSLWGKEYFRKNNFRIPGSDWGEIGERFLSDWGGSDQAIAGDIWEIISLYSVTLRLYVMKLCILKYKIYWIDARQTKMSNNMSWSNNMSLTSSEDLDVLLVLYRPGHPICHGVFLDPCRAWCVSTWFVGKKQENIPYFQSTHFTKFFSSEFIKT